MSYSDLPRRALSVEYTPAPAAPAAVVRPSARAAEASGPRASGAGLEAPEPHPSLPRRKWALLRAAMKFTAGKRPSANEEDGGGGRASADSSNNAHSTSSTRAASFSAPDPEVDPSAGPDGGKLPERPLPLVEFKEGRFELSRGAVEVLEGLRFPRLKVICIAGPYRSGKSFLLNRLMGRTSIDGFSVGGSINACTKGVWMFVSPPREEDPETGYIYLDSEGLGSLDKDMDFDAHVFALCVLLSSTLILNTPGCISGSTLEQLDTVVNLAQNIRISSEGKRHADEALAPDERSRHFPHLLWVLRDFALSLEDSEGRRISPDAYLERSLRPSAASARKSAASQNEVRRAIARVFARRECLTLVRPVHDERRLQAASREPLHRLRAEFREELRALGRKLAEEAPAKLLQGRPVTGAALAELARVYVKGINSGSLPPIRTAWRAVVEIQARRALEKAVAIYSTLCPLPSLDGKEVLDVQDLAQRHITARDRAFDMLRCVALGATKALRNALSARIEALWAERQTTNYAVSTQLCRDAAARAWKAVGFDYSVNAILGDGEWQEKRNKAMEIYLEHARGAARQEIGWQFFEHKTSHILSTLVGRVSELGKQNEQVEREVKLLRNKVEEMKVDGQVTKEKMQQILHERQGEWMEERKALMDEVQSMLLQLQQAKNKTSSRIRADSKPPSTPQKTKGLQRGAAPGKASPSAHRHRFATPARTYLEAAKEDEHHLAVLIQHASHPSQGLDVQDVWYMFGSSLRGVVSGKSVVDWLVANGWAYDRKEARDLATQLLEEGLLQTTKGKEGFQDQTNRYYQLSKGNVQTPKSSPNTQKRKASQRSMSTSQVGVHKTQLPNSILYGSKIPEIQIHKELMERKAYEFGPGERIMYFHINSQNAERATMKLTRNVTKHCMMITTKQFIKFEAGVISQRFELTNILSSMYLGFSRSGLAKLQVRLRNSDTHMIHFINGKAAVWFSKALTGVFRIGAPKSGMPSTNSGARTKSRTTRYHSVSVVS